MNTLKTGGICAVLLALIYITAFIIYGGILVYPNPDAGAIEKLAFLSDNHILLSIVNLMSYVLFGILLAPLAISLHKMAKEHTPVLSKLAYVFGIIWVGLVIGSGMIANIGLNSVIEMGAEDPEQAMLVWSSVSIVTEGLGGGNEIVGGLWVLLVSFAAMRGEFFSKPLSYLGLIVGVAGIFTMYPLDVFTEIFGLTQIIWFTWVGIALLRKRPGRTSDLA